MIPQRWNECTISIGSGKTNPILPIRIHGKFILKIRQLRQQAVDRHQLDTAIYWADKACSLAGGRNINAIIHTATVI